MPQPWLALLVLAGTPSSASWGWGTCPSQLQCLKASLEAFLGQFTLVGHLNKVWLVILQGTLIGHIEWVTSKDGGC